MSGWRCFLAFVAASLLVVTVPVLASQDPLEGTWKLNLANSTYKSPTPPKGQLRTYQMSNGVERMTSRGVNAEGKPTLVKYEARYDGQDYEITGSNGGDRISLRRIDARTTESTQKRAGKAVIVARRAVSADGKVLTVTTQGSLPDGQTIDVIMVFDRQ